MGFVAGRAKRHALLGVIIDEMEIESNPTLRCSGEYVASIYKKCKISFLEIESHALVLDSLSILAQKFVTCHCCN